MRMIRATGRAALASFGRWWKELLLGVPPPALFLSIAIMTHGQTRVEYFTLGGYTAVAGFAYWLLGFFHRHVPFFQTLREMNSRQARMNDKLDEALAEDDDRPLAEVRHLTSV